MKKNINEEVDYLRETVKKYMETRDEVDLINVNLACSKKRAEYEDIKETINEDEYNSKIQMGFVLTLSSYEDDKTILNFMAQNMIEEIIEEERTLLEGKLHRQFKSKDEFIHSGIQASIINIIRLYDTNLCEYVLENMELTSSFRNIFNGIISNWDYYQDTKGSINCDDIYSIICEFISKHQDFYGMESTLAYFIETEFDINLYEYLDEYVVTPDNQYDFSKEEIKLFKTNLAKLDYQKQKELLELKNAIKNYIKSDDKSITYEDLTLKKKK